MKKWLPALMTLLTAAVCAALSIAVLTLYREGLARRAASGSDLTPIFTWEETAARAKALLPLLALWLAGALASAALIGPRPTRSGSVIQAKQRTAHAPNWLRVLLYVCAAAFITLGALNGGLRDVLVKAVNICTECIGLG